MKGIIRKRVAFGINRYQALFERWMGKTKFYRAKTFVERKLAENWLKEMNLLFDDQRLRFETKKDLKEVNRYFG